MDNVEQIFRLATCAAIIVSSLLLELLIVGSVQLVKRKRIPAGVTLVDAVCKELAVLGFITVLLLLGVNSRTRILLASSKFFQRVSFKNSMTGTSMLLKPSKLRWKRLKQKG
eukprot:Blabericola_migrator_1__11645@NODE_700_length_6820_cov_37_868651_g509_i0_p6_GENE_NODE_700_length_6820_cov_37_868651_g509_i0NODE_700_length_6820_cov_37_868651_g509_i0_p6_ORF_typecomplete_len112_score8_04DAP10/PF07213_11/0_14DAP10/PF07213_11/2e03_NODE_700_length_6820_cov_37_868651_g509_i018432178